jgi:hypothetical protein
MTEPIDNPTVERTPDGMTILETRRLRTKYKKLKPTVIESIIDELSNPTSKGSDLVNKFKIIENLENLLNITPNKLAEDDDKAPEKTEAVFEKLKGKLREAENETKV